MKNHRYTLLLGLLLLSLSAQAVHDMVLHDEISCEVCLNQISHNDDLLPNEVSPVDFQITETHDLLAIEPVSHQTTTGTKRSRAPPHH